MNYCYYIFTPKGVNYFLQYLLYIMYNIGSVKLLYFAAFLISVSIFHTLVKADIRNPLRYLLITE